MIAEVERGGPSVGMNRPFRMMTVGSETKLSVCSDFNLNRQLSVDSEGDEDEEDGEWEAPMKETGMSKEFPILHTRVSGRPRKLQKV